MIYLWVMLLSTNQVPELGTEPYRIMAHILTEVSTAILLLVSGYGLMKNRSWSLKMFILAQGSLFYSLIASPGYYL